MKKNIRIIAGWILASFGAAAGVCAAPGQWGTTDTSKPEQIQWPDNWYGAKNLRAQWWKLTCRDPKNFRIENYVKGYDPNNVAYNWRLAEPVPNGTKLLVEGKWAFNGQAGVPPCRAPGNHPYGGNRSFLDGSSGPSLWVYIHLPDKYDPTGGKDALKKCMAEYYPNARYMKKADIEAMGKVGKPPYLVPQRPDYTYQPKVLTYSTRWTRRHHHPDSTQPRNHKCFDMSVASFCC